MAETKGNDLQGSHLRGIEGSKIACARKHFAAISENGYIYDVPKASPNHVIGMTPATPSIASTMLTPGTIPNNGRLHHFLLK